MASSKPPSYVTSVYNPSNFSADSEVAELLSNKQNLISASNRLNASFVGTGTVSNTTLDYVAGVTTPLQTQLDAAVGSVDAVDSKYAVALSGLTENVQVQLNNKQNKVANVTDTIIGFLVGVTSGIQAQINNRQPLLSASNFLDAAFIGTGTVTNAMFGFLSGVTSNIQTQLNNCAKLATANTWTNIQTFQGLEGRMSFIIGVGGSPNFDPGNIACMYVRNTTNYTKALTFMNTHSDQTAFRAFNFSKMLTGSTAADLMYIDTGGNVTINGSLTAGSLSCANATATGNVTGKIFQGGVSTFEYGENVTYSLSAVSAYPLTSVICVTPRTTGPDGSATVLYLPVVTGSNNGLRVTILLRGAPDIRIRVAGSNGNPSGNSSLNIWVGEDVGQVYLSANGKKRDFCVTMGQWTFMGD